MKKWMIFALALGVMSFTNAGLDLGHTTSWDTVGIYGFDNTGAIACYVFTKYCQVDSFTLIYAGDLAEITPAPADALAVLDESYGPITQAFALNFADTGGVFLPNGKLAEFKLIPWIDINQGYWGLIEFHLTDVDGALLGSYVLIPEPMTMGLLALGGLFIRRKK